MEKTDIFALSDQLRAFFGSQLDSELAPDNRLKTDPTVVLKDLGLHVDDQVIAVYLQLDDAEKNKIIRYFQMVAKYNDSEIDPEERIQILKEIKPIIERFLQLETQPSQFERGNW